jgi:hypothetical protein
MNRIIFYEMNLKLNIFYEMKHKSRGQFYLIHFGSLPIEGCRSAIAKMEGLFPSGYAQGPRGNISKRQKVKASLATLAWPLKESRARKLMEEVIRYKSTINLALTTEYT